MSFRFYNVYFSSVNKTIAQGNICYVVLRHQHTHILALVSVTFLS